MKEEIFFCFEDLKELFYRTRSRLKLFFLLSSALIFLFLLVQKPKYEASATFRQAATKNSGSLEGMKDLFKILGGLDKETGAFSLMHSKSLMHLAVQKMGLQAEVICSWPALGFFARIGQNLVAECGGKLSDSDDFVFEKLLYEEESPLYLYLRFIAKDRFEVLNRKKEVVALSELGRAVQVGSSVFTLKKAPRSVSLKKCYPLQITPWPKVCKQLAKRFHIKQDTRDPQLLHLTFTDSNRHKAATLLNQLMLCYQEFLKQDNEHMLKEQLVYLEKRQGELCASFDQSLCEQSNYLTSALGGEGFIDFRGELELLSAPKEEYTSKLFAVDLELKRLDRTHAFARSLPEKKQFAETEHQLLALDLEQKKISLPLPKAQSNDFWWANLKTTKKLSIDYHNQLDQIQSNIKKLLFLKEEMTKPDFEMSSLNAILEDPISRKIAEKASELVLQLRDAHHGGLKEQERIKESLLVQKECLRSHLEQIIDLEKLKYRSLEDNMGALRETSVHLMKQEKKLLEEKLQEIKRRMSHLPEKWRLENQIKFKTELSKGVLEGMSQLLEAKNLSRYLFHVESKPIDSALAPLKPKHPHLALFTLSAGVIAAIFGFLFFLFQGLLRGLPLSFSAMQAYQLPVLGKLSSHVDCPMQELKDGDLETLREASAFVLKHKKPGQSVIAALLHGKQADYARNIGELLFLQGFRSLLIDCSFSAIVPLKDKPGLWQYLVGEVDAPLIRQETHYDYLPCGGSSRYVLEVLKRGKFEAFLESVRYSYDLILLFSSGPSTQPEAFFLRDMAECTLVTVSNETLKDLGPYINLSTTSFIKKT